jgi:hypothetical protein
MLLVGLPEAGKKTEAHEARIEASHPSSRRKNPTTTTSGHVARNMYGSDVPPQHLISVSCNICELR